MAYVFNKVDDMLGDQGQQKTDIFGQQQGGQDQQQGQGQQAQGTDKTSTDGNISSGGGGGGQSAQKGEAPSQAAVGIAKVQGAKAQTPEFMTKAQGDIGSATQNLQNEANSYVQGAQQKHYGLDEGVVKGAVGGDSDAYGKVATRLGQAAPQQYESFQPKTQTSFQDINSLQNDAATKQMLAQKNGGQYTQGEGSLDMSIMKHNPQFNLLREQLLQGQRGLQNTAQQYQTDKTKEAQDATTANYTADTNDIRNQLGASATSLQQAAQARAQAAQAQRAQEAANQPAYLQQQEQAARDEFMGRQSDQRLKDIYAQNMDKYLGQSNAGQYYTPGAAVGSELYQDPEAQSFNRIQSLLGNNNYVSASDAGAGQSFNKQGLEDYLAQQGQQQLQGNIGAAGDEVRHSYDLLGQAYGADRLSDLSSGQQQNLFRPDQDILGNMQKNAAYAGIQLDPNMVNRAQNYGAQWTKLNRALDAANTPAPQDNANKGPGTASPVIMPNPVLNTGMGDKILNTAQNPDTYNPTKYKY